MRGGENIEENNEKQCVVKCKLPKNKFELFKRMIKKNGKTQQLVLEELVYEYIGRNLMNYLYIDSLETKIEELNKKNLKKRK